MLKEGLTSFGRWACCCAPAPEPAVEQAPLSSRRAVSTARLCANRIETMRLSLDQDMWAAPIRCSDLVTGTGARPANQRRRSETQPPIDPLE